MTIDERIIALRQAMLNAGLDAYIIPSSDPHLSEYVADHWKSREWISGFTGSAGVVVITADHAGLWTDSRYFIQAEEQLKSSAMVLHKLKIPHTPEYLTWICDTLPNGATIGYDGWMFSVGQVRSMAKSFSGKNFVLNQDHDLVSQVWTDRPSLPHHFIFDHALKFAGISREAKLSAIRSQMNDQKASAYFVSVLDEIAWLLNLRGEDVDCNPVFIAYVLVQDDNTVLFINPSKIPEGLSTTLQNAGIEIQPYDAVDTYLKEYSATNKVMVDKSTCNVYLYNCINDENRIDGQNLIAPAKAIKNQVEADNIRLVMEKDGVALVRFFRWLEHTLPQRSIPETEVAMKLKECRKAMGDYFGESFDAIVGYKSNGAIVHYHAEPDTCADIKSEGILLIDSGGQYLNGTTDITRTIALSTPTEQQQKDYTMVLKGNLAISMAKFPKGTYGAQFDAMARQHLWRHARNYGHGTGHGVGAFLNVHEGPQSFSPTISPRTTMPVEIGTLTSNEPGLYREGKYGIRIENLVLCVPAFETEFGEFYQFETVTLFPIDTTLIDKKWLSGEEIDWLNAYHKEVLERLSPMLLPEEAEWLELKCRPI
ncbi:MAG: aminopeptidase P family protein [Saprospiraceae bacterium]|nr:aminopeptidase P family protein [Saprospiraceae bacterium]